MTKWSCQFRVFEHLFMLGFGVNNGVLCVCMCVYGFELHTCTHSLMFHWSLFLLLLLLSSSFFYYLATIITHAFTFFFQVISKYRLFSNAGAFFHSFSSIPSRLSTSASSTSMLETLVLNWCKVCTIENLLFFLSFLPFFYALDRRRQKQHVFS